MDENKINETQTQEVPVAPAQAPQAATSDDVEKNKAMAIIGYIIPILFFIPLVTDAKNSQFAKFHANQQLNLLLFWIVGQVASSVLMVVLIGIILMPIVLVAGLVFTIMGIINASKGEIKKLPLIGGFEIIK